MNSYQQLMMCSNEIYNDNLYKEVIEKIENEWITHKANEIELPTGDELVDFIDQFKFEQANQENSGEDYSVEFNNNKQLMLYQKWCYLNMITNFGDCGNTDLFDMTTLKNQVVYWIMEDFQGFENWADDEE